MVYGEKELRKVFERFVESPGLEGYSEAAVFRDLLSRVDVPSSFAAPKKTVKTSSSSSKSYYKGMKPIISNPSTSAEQAWAICAPEAKLAGRQASSSYRPSSSSIDCDFIGRSAFCDKSSSGGVFWGGMNDALNLSMAGSGAERAVMSSCLAQFGWQR